MITVINVKGTSENNCTCGPWLTHWEKFSGKSASYCSAVDCLARTNLVGAHVMLEGRNTWFIVPLCESHNRQTEPFKVEDWSMPISANKAETFEKTLEELVEEILNTTHRQ